MLYSSIETEPLKRKERIHMKIRTQYKRAELIFDTLIQTLKEKRFPYNKKLVLVSESIFKHFSPGSKEHALFLFCVCYYMRGGIKSATAITSLSKVYKQHPDLFVPEYFDDINTKEAEVEAESTITHILQENGLAYNATVIPKHWIKNFQKIYRFWEGNPVNLLKRVGSYTKACRVIANKGRNSSKNPNGFYGFQEKMVSMLIHFYVEAGIIEPTAFPVPVDFHVLRILVAHKILTKGKPSKNQNVFGQELLQKARSLSVRYCKEHDVNAKDLSDALWFLSRNLCSEHPGNDSLIGEYRARKTEIKPAPVTWNKTQVKSYERSCLDCPVKETCCFNIPSANYYRRGELVIRGPRAEPPQLYLFKDT